MMINRFLKVFVFMWLLGFSAPVFAQNCAVQAEAIVKLRKPPFGSYNVWDSVYGEIGTDERFKDGVVMPDGHILAVGERSTPESGDRKSLVFVEIGRNGRVKREVQHDIPAGADVVRALARGQGFLVLANITPVRGRAYIWMGFFDIAGEKLSEKTLKGGKAALRAHDIELSRSGKSYILAVSSVLAGGDVPGSSVVYRLNLKGDVVSDRGFVIGAENAMQDLHVLESGDVLAVGVIDNVVGRKTGWAMRLSEDLRMIWQKPYPRGAAAEFAKVYPLGEGQAVAVGTALPEGSGNRAGWVMAFDENSGEVVWQRYFTGGLHLDGRDVLVNEDRMISVLMDGEVSEGSDEEEHVRLFTLNPRGVLFNGDAFFNGAGVDAFHFLQSPHRERVIFGETRVVHQIQDAEKMAEKAFGGAAGPDGEGNDGIERVPSREGWVIAAPRVESYEDPCKPVQREFP